MDNSDIQFFEKLAAEYHLSREQLGEASQLAKSTTALLILHALVRLKYVPAQEVLARYASLKNLQMCDLDSMDIPGGIIDLMPREIAVKNRIIPIDRFGQNIIVATANPFDLTVLGLIKFKTGYIAKPVLASETALENALKRYYLNQGISISDSEKEEIQKGTTSRSSMVEERAVIGEQKASSDDGGNAVMRYVDNLLLACLQRRASDIHIESYETFMRVRLRIDGSLVEVSRPPLEIKNSLVSRVKIMAKLDIAEKRLPQDGAINVTIEGRPIDFRVNTCPTVYGEKIVLRILDKSNLQVDMTKLGLESDDLQRLMDAIKNPYGMVLVTGPTGSGKTTTLYSALSELNQKDTNLSTAEDPVEYNLEGINQVQVNPEISLTFASALRAFLRQDPDVIMVGEIRDLETAEIAIKAALTGHMVLSTLHTNSAADTVTRLISLGIEPFNLISSLNAVIAQRLVKRICTDCKEPDPGVKADYLIQLGVDEAVAAQVQAYKGRGCPACNNTGYKGRIAIFEVMSLLDPIKEAIMSGKSAMELKKISRQNGMRTLRQNALRKMMAGVTDIYEVIQTTAADEMPGKRSLKLDDSSDAA